MRIPTFSRFCFCLDLQTGNKVLCWIFLIIYIAFVLLAVASLLFGTDFLEYRSEDVKEDVWNATFVQQELQEGKRMKFGVSDSLGTLVISLILIVVCFFFLNGINLHNPGQMMPYIIQHGVFGILFAGAAAYFLSVIFLIKSILSIYISLAAFSLYEVYIYEESQKQQDFIMNPNFKAFGQNYEAENYDGHNGNGGQSVGL